MGNTEMMYKATIVNIVDADTVDALVDLGFDISHKIRLRFLDIDTPEIRTKNTKEKLAGQLVKKWVENRILDKQVIISTYRDDLWGRYLVKIFTGDDFEFDFIEEMNNLKLDKKWFYSQPDAYIHNLESLFYNEETGRGTW